MTARGIHLPTVVELNDSPAGLTIFCVHPAGGGLRPYEALASRLADVAKVVGLEDPSIHDDEPFSSLPELAAYHVDVIRALQPVGPYVLFGSCSGGPISYEIACQLQLEGNVVAKVVMFGSHDLIGFDPAETQRFQFLAGYLAARYDVNLERLDWRSFECMDREVVCSAIVAELAATGIIPPAMETEWIRKGLDSLCRTRAATKTYIAPRSALDIDLYKQPRSQEQLAHGRKDWCEWEGLTSGRLQVIEHGERLGTADNILAEAFVDETVKQLKQLSLRDWMSAGVAATRTTSINQLEQSP